MTVSKNDLIHSFQLCTIQYKEGNSEFYYFIRLLFTIWTHVLIIYNRSICKPSRWVLITVFDSDYTQHFGRTCCLHFSVMESRLHKQCQNLQKSCDFLVVVFAWSSLPYANTFCKFNVVVSYIQRYVIYIVLLVHV